ncbi:hypothetical protein [Burkholderia sp. WAC0059]|uniref:hypothetical protein n=1 Tax=Burkholderia sp. WAC0059 TaxID=2066022 RepID=UPI002154FD1B|nr:hypothetical protein [Burkholderia sp. WAC0059]
MLTACTAVSDVNAGQDGHFTVTSHARWELVSWNHVRNAGLKRADSYCHRSRKDMHTVAIHSQGLRGLTAETVEIVFDCI